MDHCYKLCEAERVDIVDLEEVQQEGLSYFFLLKLLKAFDHPNTVIAPALNTVPRAVTYWDVRTGYVELWREVTNAMLARHAGMLTCQCAYVMTC